MVFSGFNLSENLLYNFEILIYNIMTKKFILSAILCVCTLASAFAYHHFSVPNDDGTVIYYEIISDGTVYVAQAPAPSKYQGTVVIASSVSDGEKNYSVTGIESMAFGDIYSYGNLVSVTIPSSVIVIQPMAFLKCYDLTSIINLNPTPQNIDYRALHGVPFNCKIYVPSGSAEAYKNAHKWDNFTIVVSVNKVELNKSSVTLPVDSPKR
jgi:hypothetical protein